MGVGGKVGVGGGVGVGVGGSMGSDRQTEIREKLYLFVSVVAVSGHCRC